MTPPGVAIAASLVLRDFDDLLPLRAGLAVADIAGPSALVKWPNDVWIDGQEGRGHPRRGARRLGGARHRRQRRARPRDAAARGRRRSPGRSGRDESEIDATLAELLARLEARLDEPKAATLAALRERDALLGKHGPLGRRRGRRARASTTPARCSSTSPDGTTTTLSAGEVTLTT